MNLEAEKSDEDWWNGRRVRDHFSGISETTLWRWIKSGNFPKPELVVNTRNYWRASTVRSWHRTPAKAA